MDEDIFSRLPQEVLTTILTNAVLSLKYCKDIAKCKGDEAIFNGLASVAFHWFRSLKTRYLKNKIISFSKVYFQKAKKRSAIIRNNRSFLEEVIDPDQIIFQLESCCCLTKDQVTFLTRLRNHKEKNHELLIMFQDFSSQKYSKMIDCLFLTNQTPAALVLERGGEIVKVHINNEIAWRTKEFEIEFIEQFQWMQTVNDLVLSELLNMCKRLDDVFILHAKQNKGIELWFWCKTESSLNQLKRLSDDDLREIIQRIYQRLITEHKITLNPQLIQRNYSLASYFAERRLSIRHVGDHENLDGFYVFHSFKYSKCITSLADKIYVAQKREILVYENKYPYRALEPIIFGQVGRPVSIASCSINKCLYISFSESYHIFKVEPELDNRVSEWMRGTGLLFQSVTSKGDVLVLQGQTGFVFQINNAQKPPCKLLIYTPDGEFKRVTLIPSLDRIQFVQEIMPDVMAVICGRSFTFESDYIMIMRMDEDGTLLRRIEWRQIFCISPFRYGDLLIGHDLSGGRGTVQLLRWPFELTHARDLITTDEKICSIHFAADQKQLYVLSRKKLQIFKLNYEDDDYDR